MKKVKILMLMSKYQKISGHTRVIVNLSLGLVKLSHNVTIGAFSFEKEPPKGVNKLKFKKFEFISSKFKNYDIIHNHQTKMNFYSLFTSKPFIFHYHGASMKLQKINLKISLFFCKHRISKIISVSETALEQLPKFAKIIPTVVLYNGIDTKYYHPDLPTTHKKGNPQLFFVGNLFRYKNVQLIINSMSKIIKIYPKSHLQIAGDGEFKNDLAQLIREKKLEKNIELVGRVTDEELRLLYSSCDIYISASKFETFGLPLLEAMSCGKPVVVSNISAHTELVSSSKAGLTFSFNIDDLSTKLQKVYENLDFYAKEARKFAEKNDWGQVCLKISNLYEQLLVV